MIKLMGESAEEYQKLGLEDQHTNLSSEAGAYPALQSLVEAKIGTFILLCRANAMNYRRSIHKRQYSE